MTEPKRWQEEGAPAEFARLFEAVRSEEPSAVSLQRALAAAGVLGAAAAPSAVSAASSASGTAGGLAAKSSLAGLLTKILVASLVSAAAIGVTVSMVAHRQESGVHVIAGKAPEPVMHANEPTQPSAPQAPVTPVVVIDPSALPLIPTSEQAGSASRARRSARAMPSAEAGATLLDQMALIDRARASLRAGNASIALQNASDYRRKYPAGNFTPEALFLQMQASKQLGQLELATRAARELVEHFPSGPNVGRARELLQSQVNNEIP